MCYDSIKKEDMIWKLLTIKNKKELDDVVDKEKLLINYRNKLHRLSLDKEYCRMIWDERIEDNLRKRESYILGGIKQGIEQNRTEMIINFYNNGVPIDIISKSSGKSLEEVKKIIEERNK